MKLRTRRITVLVGILFLIVAGVIYHESLREWFQSVAHPQTGTLSATSGSSGGEDFWSDVDQSVETLAWHSHRGWIPGRVRLFRWQRDHRTFYKLRAPAPPEVSEHPPGSTALEPFGNVSENLDSGIASPSDEFQFAAIYDLKPSSNVSQTESMNVQRTPSVRCRRFYMSLRKDRHRDAKSEQNQKSVGRADYVLLRNGVPLGRLSMNESMYRVRYDNGYVELIFWVPDDQPIGNIVFRYQEAGSEAWIATDKNKNDVTPAGRASPEFWTDLSAP